VNEMERIPVAGPWITQKEIEYVKDAVENAWYGNANMYHERFERGFAEYVGRRHAIALPSCTSAIHLALMALGVTSGDEVIVPDITWIASAAPVTYVGALPVFADMEPDTWCISAQSVERLVGPKTAAVIAVDLYGNMPDYDRLESVCRRHGLRLIEDAAQAAGGSYKGHKAGSIGDISVFSFHGSKTLTCGEGGMLLTDDENIYRRCLFLRDHGRSSGSKMFYNDEVAYKYKMSSMQAALGLAQLERIDELTARKREMFEWYAEALAGTDGISLNAEKPGTLNTYWMISILLDPVLGIAKESLMSALSAHKIDTRPFFYPLSSLPAYRDNPDIARAAHENVHAYGLSPFGLNLPSALCLSRTEVEYVADKLRIELDSLRKKG